MANGNLDPGGGGGGSGDREGFIRSFIEITDGGTSINVRWSELVAGIVSGLVLAPFVSLIGFLRSIAIAAERVFGAATQRLVGLQDAVFGVTMVMERAWQAATADVTTTGIFAFAFAVALAGSVYLIYSWGVGVFVAD